MYMYSLLEAYFHLRKINFVKIRWFFTPLYLTIAALFITVWLYISKCNFISFSFSC